MIRYSQLRLSGSRIIGKLLNAKRQMRIEKGGSLPAMAKTHRRAHRSNSWTLILVCSFRDYNFLPNADAYAIKDLVGAHGRELRKPEFHRSGMGRIVRIQTMRWIMKAKDSTQISISLISILINQSTTRWSHDELLLFDQPKCKTSAPTASSNSRLISK